uniref:G-protein coupled receptors family 2 profile 1 domain-containing protein n=1 Tax=Chelonoidis abingdonii TaxID=106734 RepID=A0A8C0JDS6_CHEAB
LRFLFKKRSLLLIEILLFCVEDLKATCKRPGITVREIIWFICSLPDFTSNYCPYCNRTWDGWLCWNDAAAGTISVQRCPDYFQDFNPSEKVTKICDQDGNWFKHPESNRTWTNYTQCNIRTHEKVKTALNLYYLAIIGHGLSIASLLISLGIFFYFK